MASFYDSQQMRNETQAARTEYGLTRRAIRQARQKGNWAEALKLTQNAREAGLPVGVTPNDNDFRKLGQDRLGLASKIAGEPMPRPTSGLDAYDNRHSRDRLRTAPAPQQYVDQGPAALPTTGEDEPLLPPPQISTAPKNGGISLQPTPEEEATFARERQEFAAAQNNVVPGKPAADPTLARKRRTTFYDNLKNAKTAAERDALIQAEAAADIDSPSENTQVTQYDTAAYNEAKSFMNPVRKFGRDMMFGQLGKNMEAIDSRRAAEGAGTDEVQSRLNSMSDAEFKAAQSEEKRMSDRALDQQLNTKVSGLRGNLLRGVQETEGRMLADQKEGERLARESPRVYDDPTTEARHKKIEGGNISRAGKLRSRLERLRSLPVP